MEELRLRVIDYIRKKKTVRLWLIIRTFYKFDRSLITGILRNSLARGKIEKVGHKFKIKS